MSLSSNKYNKSTFIENSLFFYKIVATSNPEQLPEPFCNDNDSAYDTLSSSPNSSHGSSGSGSESDSPLTRRRILFRRFEGHINDDIPFKQNFISDPNSAVFSSHQGEPSKVC